MTEPTKEMLERAREWLTLHGFGSNVVDSTTNPLAIFLDEAKAEGREERVWNCENCKGRYQLGIREGLRRAAKLLQKTPGKTTEDDALLTLLEDRIRQLADNLDKEQPK